MRNPKDSNDNRWSSSLSGQFELIRPTDKGWLADNGLTSRRGGSNQKRGAKNSPVRSPRTDGNPGTNMDETERRRKAKNQKRAMARKQTIAAAKQEAFNKEPSDATPVKQIKNAGRTQKVGCGTIPQSRRPATRALPDPKAQMASRLHRYRRNQIPITSRIYEGAHHDPLMSASRGPGETRTRPGETLYGGSSERF